MRGMKRPAALLLAAAMLFSLPGCAKWLPGKKAPEVSRPVQGEPAPSAEGGPAEALFPSRDQHMAFWVTDRGKETVPVQEELIREGNQMVAVYSGTPYATWQFNAEGVWRKDPKGSALLRYLPKTLKDGDTWKQTSGDAEVWFRLTRAPAPCPILPGGDGNPPAQCWWLTVLNRGERTEFHFASGLGPVYAYAENWRSPSDSFTKQVAEAGPGKLDSAARAKFISQAASATPASVTPVSAQAFIDALAAAEPPAHTIRTDVDGGDQGTGVQARGAGPGLPR